MIPRSVTEWLRVILTQVIVVAGRFSLFSLFSLFSHFVPAGSPPAQVIKTTRMWHSRH
jgi:hypothetical protein